MFGQAFLNLFVDDSLNASMSRRRSTTEDDHPPSPVGLDAMENLLTSHYSNSPAAAATSAVGASAANQRHFKSPLTPISNPATPTSPANKMQVSSPATPTSPANKMQVNTFSLATPT